jgi:hypothetical protein
LGRKLIIAGGVLMALLVIGGFAIYLGLKVYLHSDRFRGMLGERVSDTFKADGEFAEFKWTGSTAYTDDYKAHGYEDSPFSRVKAESIKTRVNFGAVRRGVWELANIDIDRVDVLVDRDDRALRPEMFEEAESAGDDDGGGGGFLSRFIPQEVEVKRIGIAELNCDVHAAKRKFSARRIRVEVEPISSSEMYRIQARRGQITVDEKIKLDLAEADFRFGAGQAIIDRAALTLYDGATLGLTGEAELSDGGLSNIDVEARVRDLEAAKVLPDDWVKKLKGTIEVDATLTGSPATTQGLSLEGIARLRGGVLEAMPVLERVDEMLGSSRFRRLSFGDFRVRFKRSSNALELQDYYVLSTASACLKGRALVPDEGAPTGIYMLGVTADTIKWLPLIKKAVIEGVFSYSRDEAFAEVFGDSPDDIEKPPEGFRWAVARIVPGAPDPYSADLREQFFKAGGMAIWGQLAGLSKQGVEALKILTDAAKTQGVNVATVLASGGEGEDMFSPENLLRAAGELGVTASMESLMKGIIDGVGELPSTLLDTGAGLLNGLLP